MSGVGPTQADPFPVELVQTEAPASRTPTSKVVAATAGAGVGSVIGTAGLWVLGVFVWGAPSAAEEATLAVAAVPGPISAVVMLALPAAFAFAAGYLKRAGIFEQIG